MMSIPYDNCVSVPILPLLTVLCLGACLGLVGDFFLIVKTDGLFAALGVTHEEVDVSSPACGTTCEAAKGAAKHGAAPRHLALSTSAQLFSRARVTQIIPTVDSKGGN